MKEIRFLKDLPCKLVNQNKRYIKLVGGDVYYDKDGNRYAYLTFENLSSSPIFYLQLSIKEYSVEGKFIKDNEFYLPYMYAPTGKFVNEEPFEIDLETEAVEVYITKATFDRQNFFNDSMRDFTNDDYIANKPIPAPIKKWENQPRPYKPSNSFPESPRPSESPLPNFLANSASPESSPVKEEVPPVPQIEVEGRPRASYKGRGNGYKFISLGANAAVFGLVIFLVYVIINTIINNVNAEWLMIYRYSLFGWLFK